MRFDYQSNQTVEILCIGGESVMILLIERLLPPKSEKKGKGGGSEVATVYSMMAMMAEEAL